MVEPLAKTGGTTLDRGWLLAVLALSAMAYGTALGVGYLADDLWHIGRIEGIFGPRPAPLDLYTFVGRGSGAVADHVARGSLPWWTEPGWYFAMLRPLSSLTLELDHWLLPRDALIHHLHSLAWLLVAIVAAHRVLRRLLPRPAWALALLLFAADESSYVALMWIANRCVFISAAFGLLAIEVHLQGRAAPPGRSRRRAQVGEAALWGLAFAGGEYALCVAGLLVVYEGVAGTGPVAERLRSLGPCAAVGAAFVVAAGVFGGSSGAMAEYVDPFGDPLGFVTALSTRLPRLVGEAWFSLPADRGWLAVRLDGWPALGALFDRIGLLPVESARHHVALALAPVALVAAAAAAASAGLVARERRLLVTFAVGSMVAAVPLASTLPHTRLLVVPGFAVAGAVALIALGAFRLRHRARGRAAVAAAIAGALVITDVAADASGAAIARAHLQQNQRALLTMYRTPALARRDLSGVRVVVLSTPDLFNGVHGLGYMNVYGASRPLGWHVLSLGRRGLRVRRVDERTFDLITTDLPLFTTSDELGFRPATRPLPVGQAYDATVFLATPLSDGGAVTRVRFSFDRPLEDSKLLFVTTTPDGLTRVALPRSPGQEAAIPSAGPLRPGLLGPATEGFIARPVAGRRHWLDRRRAVDNGRRPPR